MNTFKIKPGQLKGQITLPFSKSHTMRACILAMMGKKESTIYNYLESPDTEYMLEAIHMMGAKIKKEKKWLKIQGVDGNLQVPIKPIYVGNSGLTLRFMTAFLAFVDQYSIITGDQSIRSNRPMFPLMDALEQLGVFCISALSNDLAPLIIKGPIHSGKVFMNGEDSQFVSALLMALSFVKRNSFLEVKNPQEKPWIDLTLYWLSRLGISIQHQNHSQYFIPGGASFDDFCISIPGDLSSLAYPLVSALITHSSIKIGNVDLNDAQGDKKFIDILIKMGAKIDWDDKTLTLNVHESKKLRGITVDMNDCIDMVTILAVLACFVEGETVITGVKNAQNKECNRLKAITTELKKMGACIEEKEDGLKIKPSILKGTLVETYHDHRMALSLASAAFGAKGETIIQNIDCIHKTYSSFKKDLNSLGANIL
jgi:3-phosphoshikimate 1-carboxyvinyltransferase